MSPYKAIEEEIDLYNDKELRIWNRGYLAAIEGLLEQITEDQIRLLNRLVEIGDNDNRKRLRRLLESRLVVLDAYEEHYRKRCNKLASDAE